MRITYYLLTSLVYYLLYPYLYLRILKKKESKYRFREKLGISSKARNSEKLIWFHCSSIGELKSIFPVIDHYIKKNQILLTTSTLSSSEVFSQKYLNTKNIIHQFAPIDCPQIIKKFFSKWKPDFIIFTESEIWPNQIFHASKLNIPIILLNARISTKSYLNWKLLKSTMTSILKCFSLILCQSIKSKSYFDYFQSNNLEFIGNLKFIIKKDLVSKIDNKVDTLNKLIFVALSTHKTEEVFCINVHKSLKKNYPNLLTIIIPRHINRLPEIKKIIQNSELNYSISESFSNFTDKTDVLIINSYGVTEKIIKLSKYVFIGGSLIDHGGQNPIEVAYNNSIIFNGPYVHNFTEIYEFLNKEKVSFEIKSESDLIDQLSD
jgi:3-deoxy-D-manno-octulosonic-acid transferase